VVRKRAYEANFAEARRLLTEDDLSGALEAAKRAQGLDNTRTGIVSLIRVIEERLRAATIIQRRCLRRLGGYADGAPGHRAPYDARSDPPPAAAGAARHRRAARPGGGCRPRGWHFW
jgi:hypothetical protein